MTDASVGVDREDRHAGVGLGRHEQEVGHVAVEHEHLRAGDGVAVAALGGGGLDAALVPLAVGLGEGEGGDRLAGGDAGEVLLLGGVVAGVEQGAGGEHRGAEVRGAQQGPAHLLEHDGELHEGEALAAELLGDDQALQPELVGHLAPHGGVVALVGVHQATDLGLGRLALEELAGDAAELFLLLGKGEVHGRRV